MPRGRYTITVIQRTNLYGSSNISNAPVAKAPHAPNIYYYILQYIIHGLAWPLRQLPSRSTGCNRSIKRSDVAGNQLPVGCYVGLIRQGVIANDDSGTIIAMKAFMK